MQIDKSKYPVALLKTFENLYMVFAKKIEKEHGDIIYMEKGIKDTISLKITPKDKTLQFRFYVSKPFLSSGTSWCTIYFSPSDEYNIKERDILVLYKEIETHFTKWISIIRDYGTINITEEDIFLNEYTEEFYEEFKIMDEDAETKPFGDEQQTYIYKLLSKIETELEKEVESNPQIVEVIEEVQNLKSNIQNSTKATVIKRLSKIFAKIKKHSIKLLLDVYDVAKKEAIKRILNGGFDEVTTFIDSVN